MGTFLDFLKNLQYKLGKFCGWLHVNTYKKPCPAKDMANKAACAYQSLVFYTGRFSNQSRERSLLLCIVYKIIPETDRYCKSKQSYNFLVLRKYIFYCKSRRN